MRQATLIWSLWQRLLRPFAPAFSRPGHRRFVEWVTALILNVEEHTITRPVAAIGRTADGKALESFRMRKVRWKEITRLWRVLGHDVTVEAVVAEVEGYKKRFTVVTSAVGLSGSQVVELFCARFGQEDGFRSLKQRLGWEECRAWTKAPIERTTQVQWVAMSLLRLLQFRLDAEGAADWWSPPPWNGKKDRPSVLDVERLMRRHRPEIQRCLSAWLGAEEKAA